MTLERKNTKTEPPSLSSSWTATGVGRRKVESLYMSGGITGANVILRGGKFISISLLSCPKFLL